LVDNLETKFQGTVLENAISNLFRGHIRTCIQCRTIACKGILSEKEFMDLSMDVGNCPTLLESFRRAIAHEEVTGTSQHETDFRKQDADVWTELIEF
jgi:hypothetical protein